MSGSNNDVDVLFEKWLSGVGQFILVIKELNINLDLKRFLHLITYYVLTVCCLSENLL